jgi:hypothetical protein
MRRVRYGRAGVSEARFVVGGEPARIENGHTLIEQRVEDVAEHRVAGRLPELAGQMVEAHRTDELVVDIDAKAVNVRQIVKLVADDFLRTDRNELFPPIGFVAQPIDGIELVFDRHPPIFDPIQKIDKGTCKARDRRPYHFRNTHRDYSWPSTESRMLTPYSPCQNSENLLTTLNHLHGGASTAVPT